jgi:tripartite ATP-independent transporter DctM subunit
MIGKLLRALHVAEEAWVAVCLLAMAAIPIAEIVLRKATGTGITGATPIVQHLTLVAAMFGGALAAREGKLLALSTGVDLLPPRARAAARIAAGGVACAVSAALARAAADVVAAERGAPGVVAYGVPVWVAQLAMPVGFAVVALRLATGASETTRGRLVAGGIGAAGFAALLLAPPGALFWPGMAALALATALGAPVFTTLGGAALLLFLRAEVPVAAVPVETYRMTRQAMLPTIPLFTLAGYFLAEGGASRRLVRVFRALVGWMRGGPAVATVLVCAFFTSFTGASGVTILALGGLLMPVLTASRYRGRDALGLVTGAGSLGLLFPPSLPVILYAITAKTPVDEMFLGAFLPGIVMLAFAATFGVVLQQGGAGARPRFDLREAAVAVWAAKWELALPVVVLVGLFGGFATLVEVAAATALYAFAVETFVYRDLKVRGDLRAVAAKCGVLMGGVLLILGVALGFTNYLIDAEIPTRAVEWVQGGVESKVTFLLLLNAFLLVVGCLMDIFSAIVVVVPLIAPIGAAYGVDPVHLGVIFLANMELGYLTPPVGMNLFLSSYRFEKPLPEVYRAVVPMLVVLLASVLLITYVPWLTAVLRS